MVVSASPKQGESLLKFFYVIDAVPSKQKPVASQANNTQNNVGTTQRQKAKAHKVGKTAKSPTLYKKKLLNCFYFPNMLEANLETSYQRAAWKSAWPACLVHNLEAFLEEFQCI